jgi:signal peptidase II
MKTKIKVVLLCLLSFFLVSCDQITKDLAKQYLMYKGTFSYFHDMFRLEYVENTGAAMSLGANLPQPYNLLLLGIIPLIIMLALIIYAFMHIKQLNTFRIIAFALVFAGGIGNIIDRILRDRHVTDFMNVGINNLRTGIFNVADVCITVGVICLFVSLKNQDSNPAPVNTTPSL